MRWKDENETTALLTETSTVRRRVLLRHVYKTINMGPKYRWKVAISTGKSESNGIS